jgi:hypothetical protein
MLVGGGYLVLPNHLSDTLRILLRARSLLFTTHNVAWNQMATTDQHKIFITLKLVSEEYVYPTLAWFNVNWLLYSISDSWSRRWPTLYNRR